MTPFLAYRNIRNDSFSGLEIYGMTPFLAPFLALMDYYLLTISELNHRSSQRLKKGQQPRNV